MCSTKCHKVDSPLTLSTQTEFEALGSQLNKMLLPSRFSQSNKKDNKPAADTVAVKRGQVCEATRTSHVVECQVLLGLQHHQTAARLPGRSLSGMRHWGLGTQLPSSLVDSAENWLTLQRPLPDLRQRLDQDKKVV